MTRPTSSCRRAPQSPRVRSRRHRGSVARSTAASRRLRRRRRTLRSRHPSAPVPAPAAHRDGQPAPLQAHGRARPVLAPRGGRLDRERLGQGGRPGRRHTRHARVTRRAHRDRSGRARGTRANRSRSCCNKPVGYVSGQAEDGYEPAMRADPSGKPLGGGSARRSRSSPATCAAWLPPAGWTSTPPGSGVHAGWPRRAAADRRATPKSRRNTSCASRARCRRAACKRLQHGLELDGVKLKPAQVSWQNEHQLRFVLREGRKRQIRRMCELVGPRRDRVEARAHAAACRWAGCRSGKWRYLRADEKF